jgi:hypothetical protein
VVLFSAQPAKEGAHQQLGVEAIGLRAPVLARDRNARRMDDVGLDIAGLQPARQPEAVASRLVGDGDALDRVPGLAGFVAPPMQQLQQRLRVGELLQRPAFEAGWRWCVDNF